MPKLPLTKAAGERHLKRVRRICLAMPDVSEKLSHGEPTFFVRNRVFTMFSNNHHADGHIAVWIPVAPGLQEALIAEAPETYFRPPYVGSSGWVGIELGRVDDNVLGTHLREAWELMVAKNSKAARRTTSG